MLSQCWASSGDVGLLLNQPCVCYLHSFPIARTHSPPSGNAQCPSYIYTNKYPHVCTPVHTPPHLYVQIHIDGGASAKNFLSGRSQIINAKTCRKQFCGAYKPSFTRGMTWWPGRLTSPCDVIMVAFFVHLIWSRYLKAGKPKYISKMNRTISCDFYVRLQISLAWRKCRFINHMSTLESGHHLLTFHIFSRLWPLCLNSSCSFRISFNSFHQLTKFDNRVANNSLNAPDIFLESVSLRSSYFLQYYLFTDYYFLCQALWKEKNESYPYSNLISEVLTRLSIKVVPLELKSQINSDTF